jgi:undecaprenyl-diphosphatase
MNSWIELLLALLQGLTEPLPISSSGHLVVAQAWLGVGVPSLAFESFVNLGSVIGVIAYYRAIIFELLREAFKGLKTRSTNQAITYITQVGLASIPAGLMGVLFAEQIGTLSSVRFVGAMLFITGLLLVVVSRKTNNTHKVVTWLDSGLIGMSQAVALIPGLSRSGLTTITGLLRGIEFDKALQFSLMMYLPISIAAGGWSVWRSVDPFTPSMVSLLSLVVAAMSTYFVIGLYRRLVAQRRLIWFAGYCLLAGLLVLVIG